VTERAQPRHAAPTRPRLVRIRGRRLIAGLSAAAAVAGLAIAPMAAGAAASHDPYGYLDSAVPGTAGVVVLSGWAADPDAVTTPLSIVLTLDGARYGELVENTDRPDVAAARHTGRRVGYVASVVTTPGSHTVCALARNVGAGTSDTIGCSSVSVPEPSAADAVHYPIGYLDSASVSKQVVTVQGWALDPDAASTPLHIGALVDGRAMAATGLQAVPRADVAASQQAGPDQGYKFSLTLPDGRHTLCVTAANVGPGGPNNVGCTTVTVGTPPPTAAEIAAHSPAGALEAAGGINATTIQVRGWATDPDNKAYPVIVVAYVDGTAHTPVRATLARPDLAGNAKAGPHPGFDYTLSVGSGSHIVCLWAVNIGIGKNSYLGCQGVSSPGVAMPSGPRPATPAVNTKVVAAAKKFLGGKYVWGGEDPKVGFDCSGLVQYTYRGAGVSTPRVAQDQFRVARMISAGRAVPGDLVFYHDSQGNVYHVGIYVSPGLTYAAVDEAEGIKVQPIWDSSATYASFTHS